MKRTCDLRLVSPKFVSYHKFECSGSEPWKTCRNVTIKLDLNDKCPDLRCLDSNSRIAVFSNTKDDLKEVQFSFNYQLNLFLFFRKSAADFRGIHCLCWSKFDAVMPSERLSFRFRLLVQGRQKQQGRRPVPFQRAFLHNYHGNSR